MAADIGTQAGVAAVLGLVLLAGLILNILFLVTFIRLPSVRCPPNYPLVLLAIIDVIMCLFWLPVALAVLLQWEWALGFGYCQFHGVLFTLCLGLNQHIFVVIALERVILLLKPSKHEDIFNKTTTGILLASVFFMDFVIALFPVMGWSEVDYSPQQFQCTQVYMRSLTHIHFLTVVVYALPWLACAILYILALIKVKRMRTQAKLTGTMVMEEDSTIPWDSYAIKLHRVERRIQELNFKDDTPLLRKDAVDDVGYASDDEFWADDSTAVGDYQTPRKKRVYPFKRADFQLSLLLCLVWLLCSLCWIPLQAVAYVWALDWQDPPSDIIIIVCSTLPVLTLTLKPFFYVAHSTFRSAMKQVLPCKFKDSVDVQGL